jgi:hypothetical protein
MDVVSGVSTTVAAAVVYLKGLLWCREEMGVVSGVTTTVAAAFVYLKGLLWCREEMAVVSCITTTAATAVVYLEGPPLEYRDGCCFRCYYNCFGLPGGPPLV